MKGTFYFERWFLPLEQASKERNTVSMVTMLDDMAKKNLDRVFEEEFLPQIDALYNFAYHLTCNEDDANDLVQDTYLKAIRFTSNYDEGTNAKAWLFTIMKNAFINQYRRRSRTPNKVEFDEISVFDKEEDARYSGSFDLQTEMFEHLMGDEITNAINRLPIDYRTPILLCDIEGFKYDEIASILDVPIGTVRSRLHRARNMLKEKLQRYAEEMGYTGKRR